MDDFFDDFDKRASKMQRSFIGYGCVLMLATTVATVALVGGCVWIVVVVLQRTGVL